MAPTATGYGSAQNKTAATTVVVTTNAVIPANTLLLIAVSADNVAASTPAISSITAVGGSTWTLRAGGVIQSGASASAGSGVFLLTQTLFTTTSVASGTAITVTFNASPAAKAVALWGFSGMTHTLRGTTTAAASTGGTPSVTTTGTALVAGDLVIGVASAETNALMSDDTDTLNGSWSAISGINTTGGSAVTNTSINMQYKVVTATGAQTFNPTGGGADSVAIILSFIPNTPAITQSAYRFYADGTESGSAALAAQSTAPTVDTSSGDVNLQLRVLAQLSTAAYVDVSSDFRLQWEKNASGTWTDVSTAPKIIDSYTDTSGLSLAPMDNTLNQARGQAFLGNGRKLLQAALYLRKSGTPATSTVTAVVYAATTGTYGSSAIPTGPALATSAAVPVSSIGTTEDWYTFDFDGTLTLTNGAPYAVVATPNVIGSASNAVVALYKATGAHAGNAVRDNGGTWQPMDPADQVFKVLSPNADPVVPFGSTNLVDGAATTNRLSGGTGSFQAGKVSEDGLVDDLGWDGNNYTELLYSLTLRQVDLANGDTLRFRVLRDGTTSEMTYSTYPTVNIASSGGAALTHSATDNLAVTDSVSTVIGRALTVSVADAVSVTDSIATVLTPGGLALTANVGDTAGLTDAATVARAASLDLSDRAGTSDTVVVARAASVDLADRAGVADAVSAAGAVSANLVDQVVLTDSIATARAMLLDLADRAGITDSIAASLSKVSDYSDRAGVTDSFSTSLSTSADRADTVGITDTFATALALPIDRSDLIAVTDTVSTAAVAIRDLTDQVSIQDTATRAVGKSGTDSAGVTDSVATGKTGIASGTDTVGITDSITTVSTRTNGRSDDVGLTDSIATTKASPGDFADIAGTTDSVSTAAVYIRSYTDRAGITDDASGLVGRSASDTVGITDSILREMARGYTDLAGITDLLARGFGRDGTEYVGISDSVTTVVTVAGGRPKVWDGSTHTPKPGKVWNGSAWEEKSWKVWDGSVWEPSA